MQGRQGWRDRADDVWCGLPRWGRTVVVLGGSLGVLAVARLVAELVQG